MQFQWYIIIILFTVCFCEFIGDFVKLGNCRWPLPKTTETHKDEVNKVETLNGMIIADTHLLGPIKGHWLDKLYREWHMKRSFQAAVFLHKPHAIFVLGDLFDEGDIVDNQEFMEFVRRFHSHFRVPASIPIISAVGNHDVGFHYKYVCVFHTVYYKLMYINNVNEKLLVSECVHSSYSVLKIGFVTLPLSCTQYVEITLYSLILWPWKVTAANSVKIP